MCTVSDAALGRHASHGRRRRPVAAMAAACAGWAGWAVRAALIKRSFDIWLLEGLFPCCCFFPLGGKKQAHHKNCERARVRFAHAMRAHGP